ncbi:MAG: hypothetical protein SGARI_004509 [Bacillariaceae sp.]
MKLTDATFEHETQASTGMTTGSCCDKLRPALEEVSQDEAIYEQGIVLGTVDCSENVGVCQRFSVSKLPTIMFLHKKQLFPFPAIDRLTSKENKEGAPSLADELKSFVLQDFARMEAKSIPDPPSVMDAIKEPFNKLYEAGMESPLLGMAILTMASMLFLTILALVYVVVIKSNAPSETDDKKKKEK